MQAITYAIACLLATGLLDLVFKLYSSAGYSRGLMMAGVGFIWACLQILTMFAGNSAFSFDSTTILFGGFAAILLLASNLLLLECLGRLPVSIASTVYRLNTVPLVLMAVLLLGERPGFYGWFGVSLGLVSVFLLYTKPEEHSAGSIAVPDSTSARIPPGKQHALSIWFLLIIAASCIRALYGITSKAGLSNGAAAETMMFLSAAGWFLGGLVYYRMVDTRQAASFKSIKLIVAAGILVFVIVWFLTKALSLADAVSVMPIANMGFVAAFAFALLLRLEQPTPRKLTAILVAMVSISLIALGG